MGLVITAGTKGMSDWVYSQNLIGRGTGPFPFAGEGQDYFYYINDTDIPEDAEEAWYYFANGGNNSITGYCCALLKKPDIAEPQEVYTNNNGIISTSWFHYVGKIVDPLLPNPRYTKGTLAGANQNGYQYPPSTVYQPSVFTYKGGAPLFDDFNKMNDWLQSGSADYKSYGGIGANDETPIDKPISDSINGELASFDGLTSATNLIDLATISDSNLGILAQTIGGGWLSGNIGEGIISLKLIASPKDFTSGSGNFTVGPTTTLAKSGTFEVQGNKINKQYNKVRIGTFTFENKFNSYLDYAPYSTIRVYLPFCGMKDIDPEIVIGHTFFLDASIDYISGNIMYYGSIADDEGVDSTLYSWKGNCSTDLPITNEDFGYKVSQGFNIAGSIGGLIASKGASIVSTTEAVARGVADAKYMESGSISSNDGFSGIMYPYVVLTYPVKAVPSNYNHTIGRPSMKSATIGSLTGYTKVYSCHLENINCTNTELLEIENLLKSGVII